jgi:TolB-like protein
MKPSRTITVILCVLSCSYALAQTQDIDKELSTLAEKLAPSITEHGKKKIAVIDFTDLQGASSELGKYIAEQLTVNLVMGKRDFSVLDRANLKSILAEHKLTATGLVDPENAKKLGMFAGVDALILGTIIPKSQTISLTAKIITTDTAEIVGAARAEFKADETVQQLSSRATRADDPGSPSRSLPAPQQFSNLTLAVEGLHGLNDGSIMVNVYFRNTSAKAAIAVGMYMQQCMVQPCELRSSLVAGDGTEFSCTDRDLTGIQGLRLTPAKLTAIEPGGEIKASIRYDPRARVGDSVTSFKWQAEVVVNLNYSERQYDNFKVNPYDSNQDRPPPYCKIHNFVFDIPVTHNK